MRKAPPPVITKEQYAAMDPPQRRVALAREVLSLMDANFVTADSQYTDGGKWSTPLDEFLLAPECAVCARGAIVLALARVANELDARGLCRVSDLGVTASLREGPADAFPDALWGDIEVAFECYDDDDHPVASEWGEEHVEESPDQRLRALCQALIDNGGELFPSGAGGAS